ncbi:uncharacterized protein LOC117302896 [Asterias rubens]|uniref:uncharacterized protein LOC117302896 n=1 Tax=Asterias rubens TaxID=7604 RepID=UPI00145509E2|nr:uncharacterized protein LOC117302896 [Asterias rubens]
MESRLLGVASVAVCLLCLATPYFAKPLTQNIELSSEDRLYYFGQKEVQDFELVSPSRWNRAAPGKAALHQASFEAFGEDFNLDLKGKKGLINAATVLHKVGQDGKVKLSQISNNCDLYEGTSKKHDKSHVSASICGDKIEATVKTKGAVFHIQPLLPKHQELLATDDKTTVDEPVTKNMHMVLRRSVNIEACDMQTERITSSERQKRSTIEEPIYVEASVVADDMMFKIYGTNTEEYILTIMNQVAGMLKDSSLGVQVNLRITDIKIIESPQDDLQLSENLDETLDSFCSWQMDSKSDISILITRRDLVSAGSHQVMGKAKDVGGACDPKRRCVIGQDHGPSGLIFTLTHEIGHSLGMYHDGGLSDCVNKKNIMATVHSTGPEAFQWSECSRNDLLDFLSRPESKCLKDTPKALRKHFASSVPMPGFHYNASQQCAMTFNKNSLVASEVLNKPEICKALVCKTGKGEPESTLSPPLDGTRCGTKRDICIQGECMKVYSTLVCDGGECIPFWLSGSFVCDASTCIATRSVLCVEQHDDGTTIRVTDLSRCPADVPSTTQACADDACRYSFVIVAVGACSVTCGDGFQTRTIFCQDATTGNSVSESLCNANTRPASTQSCATGVTCPVTVSYFLGEFGQCSVTCGVGVQTRSVTCRNNLGEIVNNIDCTNAGLVAPSATQACSVNVACQENIRYIAGQLSTCSVTCGTGIQTRQIFCVNAENRVVANSVCEAANLAPLATELPCIQVACPVSTYTAVRGDYGACSVSCGTGVETRVVVCLNQDGQQVAMDLCIDFGIDDLATERVCTLPACAPLYRYSIGAYTDCSVTCGSGVRTRDVQCVNQNDESVDVQACLDLNLIPPVSTIVCLLAECPTFIYQFGNFGECSETCGDGLRMRLVICINNDTSEIVNDANCPGERPAATEPCNLQSCDVIYQFVNGPFGACNCSGIQTRLVICISRSGNELVRVDNQVCLDNGIVLPDLTRACEAPSNCLNPVWETSDFNGCSVTCDVGVQSRLVYCVEFPGSSVLVADSLCVPEDRPTASQTCNTGVECPTEYLWLAYGWGACSVTCGGGIEMRDVFCFNLNENFAQVNDSLCTIGDRPLTVRNCNLDPCTASWTTSAWTECSVSCGEGEETRTVACQASKDPSSAVVDETECIAPDRPIETRTCFVEICPSPFGCDTTTRLEGILQYTESSPGFGNDENYPNDFDCDKSLAAAAVRNRNVETPEEYYIQLTFNAFDLEASDNCQYDFLEVRDVFENTTELLCGNSYDLPLVWNSKGPLIDLYFHTDATTTAKGYSVVYNAVLKEAPPRVNVTEWSDCSASCGEGTQVRSLICYRGEEIVDAAECSELQLPPLTRPCQLDRCIEPNSCHGDLTRTVDGSIIESPDFPSSYANNVSCFNRIQAPEGMVVQLEIAFFNLRSSLDCEVDSLKISDFNSDGEPLTLCGDQSPGIVFTSTSTEVLVAFSSNETGLLPANGFGYRLIASFLVDPGRSCISEISTSGQAVFSPNYPAEYGPDENCITVIRNSEGCISLQFLDFNIHANPDGTCSDFLQLVDLTEVSLNTAPLCGSELPRPFYSASGLITVRFVSNGSIADSGYSAISRFVECTEGLWIVTEFGECSATCGEATQSRMVSCQKPSDGSPVDPALCPPDRPDAIRECVVPDCPSCDVVVEQSGILIESIKTNGVYANNQLCTTTISNPEGCLSIEFLSFELQNSIGNECTADYLEIIDSGREAPMRFCGLDGPRAYLSLSGDVSIVFKTDEAVNAAGYVAYVRFVPCPVNAFIPGNWSECSVTCGSGMRTRDVQCMDLLNDVPVDESLCSGVRPINVEPCNTEVECPSCYFYVNETGQFLTSPGFPNEEYTNNLNCVYEFESPDDSQCIRIVFLEAYLDGPDDDGACTNDIITVDGLEAQPQFVFCPESARSVTWFSSTNTAKLTFTTDESDTGFGFNLYSIFEECIEYDYVAGDYGPCSARCGGGTQDRTITCVRLSDNFDVDLAFCRNPLPTSSRACNTHPCEDCDASFGPGQSLLSSPDFPTPYLTMLDCHYNITNPDGCIILQFLDFNLQSCSECECDSLTIFEEGVATLPPLCGDDPLSMYQSTTGNVHLEFISDASVTNNGFNIFVSYAECPDTFYFTGDYSQCDVSCGGGTQMREVYCKSRSMNVQVDNAMCSGAMPPSTQPCGLEDCPFCDVEVTSPSFITSPDFPAEYPISINCEYNITAPEDMCVSVRFITFDLEEGTGELPICDKDFVHIKDLSTVSLDRRYCGSSTEIIWSSRDREVILEFSSDEENTAAGFNAYVSFITCPAFGYSFGPFSECSRPCGGGIQERTVECLDLSTDLVVADEMCQDTRPLATRPCNEEACPECNEVILTERQTVASLNFPQPYFEYSCNYLYTNLGGCVELLFIQFELPEPNPDGICDTDYLLVEDNSNQPFSYRICGRSTPQGVVSRGQTLNVTLITDSNPATFGEGYQLYNIFTAVCPTTGYVASEWQDCDRECGGGTRQRDVSCIHLESGLVVDEQLCTDMKPVDTELCNSQLCPSCDGTIDSLPYQLLSPNHPESFDPQRTCNYNITSSRCLRITFLDFNLPTPEGDMCGDTYVQIRDVEAEFLNQRICGDGPIRQPDDFSLYSWESRSGQVMVTLNSGEDIPDNSRFQFYLTEVDCPEFGFIAGNFSECSVTCGEGINTRPVECMRLATNEVVPDDMCTDPKPAETRPCPRQPVCPSCDAVYQLSSTVPVIMAPPKDGTWTSDVNCEYTITADTSCVQVSALSFHLSDPDENNTCSTSFLSFTDGVYDMYSQEYCGSTVAPTFLSLTPNATVVFSSDNYEQSTDTFALYVRTAACPSFMYRAGQFSQCSLSCGGGTQVRDVTCERTDLNVEVPEILCTDARPDDSNVCNDFECPQECDRVLTENNPIVPLTAPTAAEYQVNATCTNNLVVRVDSCAKIDILSIDIEESAPGVCDGDYLEIIDSSFPELNLKLCGQVAPTGTWRSRSSIVRVVSATDATDNQPNMYVLNYSFDDACPTGSYSTTAWSACSVSCGSGTRSRSSQCVLPDGSIGQFSDCPGIPPTVSEACNMGACPEYYYNTGDFSDCSTTCGAGTSTRVVTCRAVADDTVVSVNLCSDLSTPETTMACNLQPCADFVVNDPSTTRALVLGDTGTITSPNYPSNYPDSLNGELILTYEAGTILKITINQLALVFDTPCANGDSINISSGTSTLAICSALVTPSDWFSSPGELTTTITFTTSATNSDMGFSATYEVLSN